MAGDLGSEENPIEINIPDYEQENEQFVQFVSPEDWWRGIFQGRAENPPLIEVIEPIEGVEYKKDVVDAIRSEVLYERNQGKSGGKIYRQLAKLFHPDKYADQKPEVKLIAHDFQQTLQAMKESGKFDL